MRKSIRERDIEEKSEFKRIMNRRIEIIITTLCLVLSVIGVALCMMECESWIECIQSITFLSMILLLLADCCLLANYLRGQVLIVLAMYSIFILIPQYWLVMNGVFGAIPFISLIILSVILTVFHSKLRIIFYSIYSLIILILVIHDIYWVDSAICGNQNLNIIGFISAYVFVSATIGVTIHQKEKAFTLLLLTSYKDNMTGAWNSRYLLQEMPFMEKRWVDNKRVFTLVMFDINAFKKFNDSYGHAFGDEVLKQVANSITRLIEPEGCLIRYGGDEFIIVYEGYNNSEVNQFINKINDNLNPIDILGNSIDVSISFGSCDSSEADDYNESILVLADRRMYEEKKLYHQSH